MKLFVCIILQALSNQTWFDLNLQYSLKIGDVLTSIKKHVLASAKTCFYIDVNTSPIEYHTSNIILVFFLKLKKKKYKSTSV